MLVNEVVNSKAIALAATKDASNDIPFLGKRWFPEAKKAGLDLKWIKTHKGLPVSLAPSNFDSLPVLRARKGLKTEKTQMAFFREQIIVTEEDAQEIDRIKDDNDPYLQGALQSIYDDTNTLVSGAEVVPERMIMSLLSTTNGHPVIGIESDGVKYAYDYDPDGEYTKEHYAKLTTTNKWSDTAQSKPLTDLNNGRKALQKKGRIAKYALMNSNTFQYLLDNAQVKNSLLAQNSTAIIELTDENVKAIVKARTGLTIVLYDKMYIDDAGKDQYFYPNDKVTLLPEGTLGKTWFGTTPEERTAGQVADVDVSMYGVGIAIATKTEYGPPALTSVTASEIVLPSYENMDSTFVLEVHSA
ncbi:MAG: major capsid protein [Coprococcus sp.]